MTRPSAPGGNVDATVDGGLPPLIPEGPYHVRLLDWATVNLFGRRPKLVLYLSVCDQGEYFETRLERWYNVKALVGPPRRRGRFKLGRSSDFVREYAGLCDRPFRPDRIALSWLQDKLLLGQVLTVKTDYRQRPLAPCLYYSTVKALSRANP